MSGESNRLKQQARQLRALADQVERLLATPEKTFSRLYYAADFAGPFADETSTDLSTQKGALLGMADNLRDEASTQDRQAAHLEDTDSVFSDVGDFITGTDYTPWS